MKSLYEKLGDRSRQVRDYLIAHNELPEKNYEIGKYGRMRHRYLKEHCHSHEYTGWVAGCCWKSWQNNGLSEGRPRLGTAFLRL